MLSVQTVKWLYRPYKYFGRLPNKKLLLANEQAKRAVAGRRTTPKSDRPIMFLIFTNHIKNNKISRLDRLLTKIQNDKKHKKLVVICSPLSELPTSKRLKYKNIIYAWMEGIKAESLEQLYYETFKKIIQKYNVKVIFFTGDGHIIERCAIQAAYDSDIYTMLNSHGYISPKVTDYTFHKKALFCAFGQEQKEILLNIGFKQQNIRQTGALTFDELFRQNYNLKQKHNLFLTQAAIRKKMIKKSVYRTYMKKYMEQFSQLDTTTLIKPHPADNFNYKKIIDSYNIKIKNSGNLNKMIADSKTVISFRSSTILNAMILKKPVVVINLLDKTVKKRYDISRENKILTVLDKDDNLKETIEGMNKQGVLAKQNKYLENYFYKRDGKAFERIAEYMYDVV